MVVGKGIIDSAGISRLVVIISLVSLVKITGTKVKGRLL
jgi:hypothetical protein